MKKYILPVAAIAAAFATSASAETTQCTEITALPAVITVQGIYCFKGNLVTGISGIGENAITINTNNVTIDMNGFKLGGQAAGAGTRATGIRATGRKNITILNGNIRGFFKAIYLDGTSGSGHVIEQVRADGNTETGFEVRGDNIIIRNNHVINTGSGSVFSTALGIVVFEGSNILIADNVISKVTETDGARGISIFDGSAIEIKGNSIYEIDGAVANTIGIRIEFSDDISILNNRIINPNEDVGTTGIIDISSSTGVLCDFNITIRYSTATSGCDAIPVHYNFNS